MEYTIIVNGQSYDLPKKTIVVMSELDEVLKVDSNTKLSIKQKYEKIHAFIKNLVGYESAKEIFGSDDLNEIDLSELTITIKKVVDAYDSPVKEYDEKKRMERLNGLPIDKILSVANAAEKIVNMPQQK